MAYQSGLSISFAPRIDAYADLRARIFAAGAAMAFGDPEATVEAILKIVDRDTPLLRFFVGKEGLPFARVAYADRSPAGKSG